MKYSLLTTTALCALLAGGMSSCKKEAANLPAAAARGDLETVKDMVEDGVDIDAKEVKLGGTALHEASAAGYAELVSFLLENGADPTVKDKKGETPLFRAARNGHNEVMKVYVEKLGAKLRTEADPQKVDVHCNPAGSTLLLPAAWGGHADVVQSLLAAGVDPNKTDAHGNTPLLFAVRQFPVAQEGALAEADAKRAEQYRSILNMLLQHTPMVNINAADLHGNTPLIYAAQKGSAELVKLLMAQPGVDYTCCNLAGYNALAQAIVAGHADLAAEMFAAGAVPSPAEVEALTLSIVTAKNSVCPDFVSRLVKVGVDLNAQVPAESVDATQASKTALMLAVEAGHSKVASALLAAGADANVKGPEGMTALMLAVLKGQRKAVDVLLAAGADVNAVNAAGKTALTLAQEVQNPMIIESLQKAGAVEAAPSPAEQPAQESATEPAPAA